MDSIHYGGVKRIVQTWLLVARKVWPLWSLDQRLTAWGWCH